MEESATTIHTSHPSARSSLRGDKQSKKQRSETPIRKAFPTASPKRKRDQRKRRGAVSSVKSHRSSSSIVWIVMARKRKVACGSIPLQEWKKAGKADRFWSLARQITAC